MVVEMVPLKGGIGSIFHPPEGKDYKWYIPVVYIYILPIGGWTMPPTYHLLREPKTTIHIGEQFIGMGTICEVFFTTQ